MKRSTRKILRKLLGVLVFFGPAYGLLLWACKWSWLMAIESLGMCLGATVALGGFMLLMFWGMDLMRSDR